MGDVWKKMEVAPVNEGVQNIFAWEFQENLIASGNGAWIIIPDEVAGVAVTVSFASGGTGKVQTTTDKVAFVKAGSSVVVKDWDLGTVSGTTQDYCKPCTAIRAVQIASGTMQITVRAQ